MCCEREERVYIYVVCICAGPRERGCLSATMASYVPRGGGLCPLLYEIKRRGEGESLYAGVRFRRWFLFYEGRGMYKMRITRGRPGLGERFLLLPVCVSVCVRCKRAIFSADYGVSVFGGV